MIIRHSAMQGLSGKISRRRRWAVQNVIQFPCADCVCIKCDMRIRRSGGGAYGLSMVEVELKSKTECLCDSLWVCTHIACVLVEERSIVVHCAESERMKHHFLYFGASSGYRLRRSKSVCCIKVSKMISLHSAL